MILTARQGIKLRLASDEPVSLRLLGADGAATMTVTPEFGPPLSRVAAGDGTFPFPAVIAAPNLVEIEWTDANEDAVATARAEVVESHYFPIDALKHYGNGRDGFADMGDDELHNARQAATEVFETNANRCFVKRLGRSKDFGHGEQFAMAHDLDEILTDGYVQDGDSTARRVPGFGPFPRIVEYVYGADEMPADVSLAVLELAAYILRPSNRPIGATGESSDAGYIHFTTAGRDGATAIPEVNAAIEQFGAGRRLLW